MRSDRLLIFEPLHTFMQVGVLHGGKQRVEAAQWLVTARGETIMIVTHTRRVVATQISEKEVHK